MNLRGVSMRGGHINSRNQTELFLQKVRRVLGQGLLLSAVAAGTAMLGGCTGLVSGASSSGNPPSPSTLVISNIQTATITTSSSQIVWATNVPANSSVDYGTTTAYGNSTPVDSTMVTSHQVTISGVAAGTTYYYQVNSSDSKGNNGHSGGNKLKTAGFSIAGTISPSTGGNGATVTLGCAASATTTADSSGNYTLAGLPNGTYMITPSHAGYTFTPSSQSMTLNGGNITGVNFTDNAAAVAPTITTQPANQTVTAGQTATFAVVAAGTAPLTYQWQKNGANLTGATSASYTTPATTTADSGSTFRVVVANTAGTVTSAAATLTVTAAAVAPTITTPPANQTVTAGQTATFTVVAGGTAPLSYQWQKSGVNIAGATSASYTTQVTTTTDSGSTFDVVVTNTAGTVTSAAATLTVNAAPPPAIQVNPTSINFGNDVVGTNLSQALIIRNTGTAALTITQVNPTVSVFSVSGFSLPLNVAAGQQTTITVAFRPTTAGAASGNLSMVSNAPGSPTSIGLSGTGVAATLTLNMTPTSLSFGNVTTGTSSASENVTITNTGNANITISQISVSGTGYSLTGGSTPVTLTPSQNLILVAQFSPLAAGSVSGSISIVSNASGSPASVTLSGTGVAPVQHSVTLSWNGSTSVVSGYNVYRSTVSGSSYVKINTSLDSGLGFTDTTVQSGTTYYYVTTAVDASNNESAFSNEVPAVIP